MKSFNQPCLDIFYNDRLLLLLSATEHVDKYDLERERTEKINSINARQNRLLSDIRVQHQWEWFHDALDYKPPKFYTEMASIGINILKNGRPAETSLSTTDADFLVMNCNEYVSMKSSLFDTSRTCRSLGCNQPSLILSHLPS